MQTVPATIVPGHRVASGLNGDPRFPGGTIRMQLPHFVERGLDLTAFHPGTLNVSIAPWMYRVMKARHIFTAVKWHPTEPAEDFSFFEVNLSHGSTPPIAGLIYYPHPNSKPEHFQNPDVLELLLPWTEGLGYDLAVTLQVPSDQMMFEAGSRKASL